MKYSSPAYEAAILQGLTLGRLPSLLVADDGIYIVWRPKGPRIPTSPRDLTLIYQIILFHASDSPLPLRDVLSATSEIARRAFDLGVDVDEDLYPPQKIF